MSKWKKVAEEKAKADAAAKAKADTEAQAHLPPGPLLPATEPITPPAPKKVDASTQTDPEKKDVKTQTPPPKAPSPPSRQGTQDPDEHHLAGHSRREVEGEDWAQF
jgi:hypothetical protein